MRKLLIVAAALSAAFMATADAAKKTGKIIAVDAAAKTFVCEWNKVSYTYKVTDKTTFRARGKGVEFSDVKIGAIVNIGYRTIGGERIADWVTIDKR
jgi:hypothetical protein